MSNRVPQTGRAEPGIAPLALLPPFVVFLAIPATVARNNEIDVFSVPSWVWLRLGALGLVAAVLLLVLLLALSKSRLGLLFKYATAFGLFFVVWSGFFFPLSRDTGTTDFQAAPLRPVNLAIVLVLSVLLTYVVVKGHWRSVLTGLGLFILANMALALIPQDSGQASPIRGAVVGASSTFNVFVVSFDGLSRTMMEEVINSDPTVRQRLSGFTVFSRSASTSPSTTASIVTELYGNRNYKRQYDTTLELRRHDPEHLMTNALLNNGFNTTAYGNYTVEFEGQELAPNGRVDQSGLILLHSALARSLTRFSVPTNGLGEPLEEYLTRAVQTDARDREANTDNRFIEQVLASPTHAPIKEHTLTVLDYRDFVRSLAVDTADPVAFFLHFTHTHFPVEFDSECDYRADDQEWFDTNQNYEGTLAEHRCAAKQLGSFLDKIEALGILDQSIVILKGDHGKPTRYAKPNTIEATPIKNHIRLGVSRYAPFLAIKAANSDVGQPIRWSSEPVVLDDLARTLCEETAIEVDCSIYPGYNILRDSVDPSSEVTMFIVESDRSNYRYDEHVALTIERGESVVTSLVNALKD